MLDHLKIPSAVARLPETRLNRKILRWRPPAPPRGWSVGPPDFVGVGAQRAGSSWWYRIGVESHPAVARVEGRMKELHYFDRFWEGNVPEDFVERYHDFCPRPKGAITGEWTPRYMFDHWSMRLLHEAAPEARILVILRDPIERFRSGLTMPRRFGLSAGPYLDRLATAVARSAYADQLRRVFQFYPRDRVLVLQYERCTADPVGEILRTWRFLQLDPGPNPPTKPPEEVRPPSQKPPLPAGLQSDLVARLRHDVEEVAELCPEIDVSLWKNFSQG